MPLGIDHFLARARDPLQWILARVIHGGGGRHRRGQKRLNLVGAKAVLLQPQGQLEHVLIAGARVSGDEIRDQVLLLAGLLRVLVEQLLEAVVGADAGLHHFRQRALADGLGRDFEIAAGMMGGEFLDILGRFDRQVVAHAGSDQNFLTPFTARARRYRLMSGA